MVMCDSPTTRYALMSTKTIKSPNDSCSSCPGLSEMRDHLKMIFNENQVTYIQYEKCKGPDRFTIITQVLRADDFVDCPCNYVNILEPHAYIAAQQSLYLKTLKETIAEG